MALTKDQWALRLRAWVPDWVFEEEGKNLALFNGMAELLSLVDSEVDDLISDTFIDDATAGWLDLHARERAITRFDGETDANLRVRIKASSTKSKCALADMEAIVSSLITTGEFWVRDDFQGGSFCDRDYYLNRRDVVFDVIHNGFTILVDNQGSLTTLQLIADSVANAKAFGVTFRLIERVV